MVKLSPEDQHNFCKEHPEAFTPVKGAWGRLGATSVLLKAAYEDALTSHSGGFRSAGRGPWRHNVLPVALTRRSLRFSG